MATSLDSNAGLEGFISFKDPYTRSKILEVARKELGETEELKKECLEQLKTLIRNEGVRCITRDDFLLRFLRTKKFNVEASFKALRNYANLREKLHNDLSELRPEVLEAFLELNTFGFLPYRDAEGRLICLVKSGAWDTSVYSFKEIQMVFILFLNYASESESSQTVGVTGIWDNETVVLKQLSLIAFNARSLASLLFNCMPIRYRKVHSINEHPLLKFGLQMIQPFLPQKMKQRILCHGEDREALFEHFPPCILPSDFGGTLGPLTTDHLRKLMFDYLQKMKDEQHYFL